MSDNVKLDDTKIEGTVVKGVISVEYEVSVLVPPNVDADYQFEITAGVLAKYGTDNYNKEGGTKVGRVKINTEYKVKNTFIL